ncbi:ANTAR domain-containing protein [Lapillicoccus jejuensis]|uniref:ANTAR domain-containing protein n=1 Tax=Lapillicoccus jejuensis TaxID=402171 RepID=A0A542DXM6_9MICO|nr:ANTAR domain-containing protein [Lapillicoccus jejuensis]TQJ07825.1 ANTAR domain-containing protein [Lapillicoccus jejuensis]
MSPSPLSDPSGLAALSDELGHLLRAEAASLGDVVDVAAKWVPGTAGASITSYRGAHFTTDAATDERVRRADALQYDLGSGPCVDAVLDDAIYHPDDLLTDGRWPEFGSRVAHEEGYRSLLSYRLHTGIDEVVSGLNLYADEPGAYDDTSVARGLLVATRAAAVIAGRKMSHLQKALESSRDIGAAVGVLMSAHKVTREQAFDLLSIASQRRNRRLRDVAAEVVESGWLQQRSEGAQA